ncbi:hypothetical protein [Lactobacillus sp. wkB8]
MVAQFIGSGLLLFVSYSDLAVFNALTFSFLPMLVTISTRMTHEKNHL